MPILGRAAYRCLWSVHTIPATWISSSSKTRPPKLLVGWVERIAGSDRFRWKRIPQTKHLDSMVKRSIRGITNLVWDPLANDSFPFHDLKYVGCRERRPFQCPVTLSFPTNRTRPTDDIALPPTVRSYPVLQFWTLSVYFNIEITNRITGMGHILDKFGNTCGALYPDGLEETTFFNSAGPFELITLSSTFRGPRTWLDSGLREIFKNPNSRSTDEFYNVMVLEWSEGVAERRGIGLVRQDSVTKSLLPGPAWKEIFLA